jgi:outer membrane protein assembly factor BamA
MPWRTAFSSGPLLLILILLLCIAPVLAQVDRQSPPCSSSSVKSASATAEAAHPKVVIDEVRFDGPIHLPDSVINEMVADANNVELDAANSAWVNQFAEAGIRDAWQSRGYFRVSLEPTEVEPLGGDARERHFRVTVHIDEGLQYHLGDLTFANSNPNASVNALSLSELREAVPLREGELFDVRAIRAGIEALNKKYAAIGFIDFTAVPETEIDDKLQRISVTLRLDEEKQYRLREVNVAGLDPALDAVLSSELVPGDIFNSTAIDDFVKRNRSFLPMNLRREDYLQAKRDTRLGTVDLSLDFRGCREPTL